MQPNHHNPTFDLIAAAAAQFGQGLNPFALALANYSSSTTTSTSSPVSFMPNSTANSASFNNSASLTNSSMSLDSSNNRKQTINSNNSSMSETSSPLSASSPAPVSPIKADTASLMTHLSPENSVNRCRSNSNEYSNQEQAEVIAGSSENEENE